MNHLQRKEIGISLNPKTFLTTDRDNFGSLFFLKNKKGNSTSVTATWSWEKEGPMRRRIRHVVAHEAGTPPTCTVPAACCLLVIGVVVGLSNPNQYCEKFHRKLRAFTTILNYIQDHFNCPWFRPRLQNAAICLSEKFQLHSFYA